LPKRTPTRALYTTGEVNQLIDSVLHPLAKRDPRVFVIDTVLHTLTERDLLTSSRKFLRYNMPILLSQVKIDGKHRRSELRLVLKEIMKLTRELSRKRRRKPITP